MKKDAVFIICAIHDEANMNSMELFQYVQMSQHTGSRMQAANKALLVQKTKMSLHDYT